MVSETWLISTAGVTFEGWLTRTVLRELMYKPVSPLFELEKGVPFYLATPRTWWEALLGHVSPPLHTSHRAPAAPCYAGHMACSSTPASPTGYWACDGWTTSSMFFYPQGLGLGLAFFHEPNQNKPKQNKDKKRKRGIEGRNEKRKDARRKKCRIN